MQTTNNQQHTGGGGVNAFIPNGKSLYLANNSLYKLQAVA